MEQIIRIGYFNDPLAKEKAKELVKKLEHSDRKAVTLEGFEGVSQELLAKSLTEGMLDVGVLPLTRVPVINTDHDLVIAALSDRTIPADWLVIHPDFVASDQTMKIKSGCQVGHLNPIQKAQLHDFRGDLSFVELEISGRHPLTQLVSKEIGACLLPAAYLTLYEQLDKAYEFIKFTPKEFIPAPGQGVFAFQTHKKDLALRRLLKQFHHSEVSNCTNVERTVLKILGGDTQMPLGVFCETARTNIFNIWAVKALEWEGPLKRVRLSSSTTFGLAEGIAKKLK